METSTQFQELDLHQPVLTSIVSQFKHLVKQLWDFSHSQPGQPHPDFAELEAHARQLSQQCFALALQHAIEQHRQRVETEWVVGQARCECGQPTQYKGRQSRTIQTWVGAITVQRAYFYCRPCGKGRYPLDNAMGIEASTQFSDGLQQGICLLGVQMPFERASHAFEVLTGISISPRETERITEQRGLVLEQRLASERQQLLRGDQADQADQADDNEVVAAATAAASSTSASGVWAAALDAGKVRYEDGWHDTKAGVVFRAEPKLDEQGHLAGAGAQASKQSYVAEVGSMEQAGERLSAEAAKRGIGPEEMVVCLGDGAPANWKQFDLHFPNRVEVLDWYHAVEHLWAAGNGIFGQGTPQAGEWVAVREKELWEGRVEEVIAILKEEAARERAGSPGSPGMQGEAAGEQIHYFETNKERMRYSQYRGAGYPIGSGTVESACKQLIGGRLKGAGMCWGKPGAQGVLTLRAELLSERWEQSWPRTRSLRKVA
jgi:hypothetical protein